MLAYWFKQVLIFLLVAGLVASLLAPWWVPLSIIGTLIILLLLSSETINYLNARVYRQYQLLNMQLELNLSKPMRSQPHLWWLLPENWVPESKRSYFGFSRSYPSLTGRYLGRSLTISTEAKMINENKSAIVTSVILDVFPVGRSFEITASGFGLSLAGLFKRNRSKTGDKSFDSRFSIHTDNPDYFLVLMDEDIRRVLKTDVFSDMGRLSLDGNLLTYEEAILPKDEYIRKKIERVVLVLYMIAKKMEYSMDIVHAQDEEAMIIAASAQEKQRKRDRMKAAMGTLSKKIPKPSFKRSSKPKKQKPKAAPPPKAPAAQEQFELPKFEDLNIPMDDNKYDDPFVGDPFAGEADPIDSMSLEELMAFLEKE